MNSFGILVLIAFVGIATCGIIPNVPTIPSIPSIPTIPSLLTKNLCQTRREAELNSTAVGKVVPECEANGDFKSKACSAPSEDGKQFCKCYSKDGKIAKELSELTKSCECHRAVYEAKNPPRIGAFEPSCQPDGTYAPKQCHGSTGMCWCAHPNGEKKTEPKFGDVTCP